MKSLFNFIQNFINRSGNYIFVASIASRLLSFFASWIALQLIVKDELGVIIYAYQIILFIMPISNFGLNQGLIRYAPLMGNDGDKNNLYSYIFRKGIILCLISSITTICIAYFYTFKNSNTQFYLSLLSLAYVTNFLFEIGQIRLRVLKKNKTYALTDFLYNFILILLVFSLSYAYGATGYALALICTPLLAYLINFRKFSTKNKKVTIPKIINFTFWRYGFFAGLSNVTTNMLIAIDLILIGNIMLDMQNVTAFRYVSLIPFSVIILSQIVITTDFVTFTEKIHDKTYLKKYILNYIKLFTFISITYIFFIILFGKKLLYLFQSEYVSYYNSLLILSIGVCGILMFRGIYGNLLSSLGKAYVNFFITFVSLGLNYLSNIYLIPKYGIQGAAITTASLMWLTSFACAILFYYYFNKHDKTSKIS